MQKRARLEGSHIGRLAISESSRRPRQDRQSRPSSKRSMTLRRKTKKVTIDLPVDAARSALMGRVRQKHSAPELAVRAILRDIGIRYRLHQRSLPGSPDICIPAKTCAIFVHGCFWHRHASCKKASTPKTRTAFWNDKFTQNIRRDARNSAELRRSGWRVITVWECQCGDYERLKARLTRLLS
jgi:DNA mismatch endonuclease (patch repair protein)